MCGFVWLSRIQATPFGLFTKTEGSSMIKVQNVALPSSPSTSPVRICAFTDTSNIQRRKRFLKMWDRVFEIWRIPAQRELKWGGNCRERGNCRFHFWVHNQKVYLGFSVSQIVWIPTAKRCFGSAHIYKVPFHFFCNFPFLIFFLPYFGNFRIRWGHFLPPSHIMYFLFPVVDAPWMCW